jgi:hypothetical protein
MFCDASAQSTASGEQKMKAIFVTRFVPSAVGHGGQHRSYQVRHDLQTVLGQEGVHVYTPQPQPGAPPAHTRSRRLSVQFRLHALKVLLRAGGNPYPLMAEMVSRTFRQRRRFGTIDVGDYQKFLASVTPPLVCVVDHPIYAAVAAANRAAGIPTINCTQNLETFDLGELGLDEPWGQYGFMVDFVSELKWLAECDARLLISRVEAGVVGGLGFATHYYPYRPVGEVRARLEAVRARRQTSPQEPGLLLMVGSAAHATTREAFEWFVGRASSDGLPPGLRVVIGGLETERLLPAGAQVPGIELRGWLSQPELDDWLARCAACLAPQARGFGALTRLPELAYAGIPSLVSEHASHALDLPPGARSVLGDWNEWRAALQAVAAKPEPPTAEACAVWEARQPNPLPATLRRWAA